MGVLTAELLALAWSAAARGVCRVAALPPASAGPGADRDPSPSVARALAPGHRAAVGRGIMAWMIGGLTQQAARPADGLRSMMEGVLRWPDVVRLVVPGRASRAAWTEFRNKADAFGWFATAGTALGMPDDGWPDLGAVLRRVELMGRYEGLWTTEGVGYHQAEALRDGNRLRPVFAGGGGEALPVHSLIPLHAGMGLALAGRCIEGCMAASRGADVRRQLERFVSRCHENARGDYWAVSLEALGLSARLLRPRLVPLLDGQLRQMEEDLVNRFWHGVGRGLYFGPATVLPCGGVIWPIVRQACRESPREEARCNALAGLGMALTLVNIRHPEVIEGYLDCDGGGPSEADALADGVGAALRIWSCWARDEEHTDARLPHRPAASTTGPAGRWERLVRDSGREALRHCPAMTGSDDWPGGLFRYRPPQGRSGTGRCGWQ
jgi:hypothetical protein